METVSSLILEVGNAAFTLPGETASGDRHLVRCFSEGALLAVVDGVGHGAEAAEAAEIAVATLAAHPWDPVVSLVRRCHERLSRTRGAVMSIASIDSRSETVSWLCVGNVESILVRADAAAKQPYEAPVPRGGVVGGQLPPIRAAVTRVTRGDMLVLATDGIRSGFARGLPKLARPQHIADHILAHHRKGTDDALVLVARYLGDRQ
jgi:serine phosphatase RsbU (regulator of sigma subunit)